MLLMASPPLYELYPESKLSGLDKKKSEISPSDWDMPMLKYTNALNVKHHSAINRIRVRNKIALNVATLAVNNY